MGVLQRELYKLDESCTALKASLELITEPQDGDPASCSLEGGLLTLEKIIVLAE